VAETTANVVHLLLTMEPWSNPGLGIPPTQLTPVQAAQACTLICTGRSQPPLAFGRHRRQGRWTSDLRNALRHLQSRGFVRVLSQPKTKIVASPAAPVCASFSGQDAADAETDETTSEMDVVEEALATTVRPAPADEEDPYRGTMFDLSGMPPLTDAEYYRLVMAVQEERW
jgi:hypothetical protein